MDQENECGSSDEGKGFRENTVLFASFLGNILISKYVEYSCKNGFDILVC